MRVLVQRVSSAAVGVNGGEVSRIGNGLLLFVAIGKHDTDEDLKIMTRKVAGLRIFDDLNGKINHSIKEANGEVLSVPQFTLYADTRRGNRPGFEMSAGHVTAIACWKRFNDFLRAEGLRVKEGVFGAHMEVGLVNDGPFTLWMDTGR